MQILAKIAQSTMLMSGINMFMRHYATRTIQTLHKKTIKVWLHIDFNITPRLE